MCLLTTSSTRTGRSRAGPRTRPSPAPPAAARSGRKAVLRNPSRALARASRGRPSASGLRAAAAGVCRRCPRCPRCPRCRGWAAAAGVAAGARVPAAGRPRGRHPGGRRRARAARAELFRVVDEELQRELRRRPDHAGAEAVRQRREPVPPDARPTRREPQPAAAQHRQPTSRSMAGAVRGGGAQADQAARAVPARAAPGAPVLRVTGLDCSRSNLAAGLEAQEPRGRPARSSTSAWASGSASDYVYSDFFATARTASSRSSAQPACRRRSSCARPTST